MEEKEIKPIQERYYSKQTIDENYVYNFKFQEDEVIGVKLNETVFNKNKRKKHYDIKEKIKRKRSDDIMASLEFEIVSVSWRWVWLESFIYK